VIKVECATVSLDFGDQLCQRHWTMGLAIMLCLIIKNLTCINDMMIYDMPSNIVVLALQIV
jgi:hypothetical protein